MSVRCRRCFPSSHGRVPQVASVLSHPLVEVGLRLIGLAAIAALGMSGGACTALRYTNSTPFIEHHIRATDDGTFVSQFKAAVLYPARDILTADLLWRLLFGDQAWNVENGRVADSSFFTDRAASDLSPERVGRGSHPERAPVQPFSVDKVKDTGATVGFFGTDAGGRKFLVKLDHPDFPELGSSATLIAARIYHALEYNVPETFLVTLSGTGDERFDGRLAVASPLIPDVQGHFQYDWFRYRREVRGLRLVAAWINDTDRTASNTLVSVQDGVARYYLIDFNSALGAWQGRPKEPWRGWRHAFGSPKLLLEVFTLGLVRPGFDADQPVVSPGVGRFDANFDPMTWTPQVANTAFDHMTDDDRRWTVERIARLGRPHLEAVVHAAGLSDPRDRAYLVDTLLARQARILALADVPSQESAILGEPRASQAVDLVVHGDP